MVTFQTFVLPFFQETSSLNHTTCFSLCVATSSWFEAVGLLGQWSVCADPTLLITHTLNAKPHVCCVSINLSQEGSSHSPRRHVYVNFENYRPCCSETAVNRLKVENDSQLYLFWYALTLQKWKLTSIYIPKVWCLVVLDGIRQTRAARLIVF